MALPLAGIAAALSAYGAYKGSSREKREARSQQKAQRSYEKAIKSGDAFKQIDPYSKSQRKLLDWLADASTGHRRRQDITRDPLYQAGSDYLEGILSGDPEASRAFEEPAMRQFYEDVLPDIAERYSGAGAGSSSAFGLELGYSGSSLAERLAAMRAQLQQNALGQALQYAQQPITNRMEMQQMALGGPMQVGQMPYMAPVSGGPGFGEQLGGIAGGALGAGLGTYLGGSMGSMFGGAQRAPSYGAPQSWQGINVM